MIPSIDPLEVLTRLISKQPQSRIDLFNGVLVGVSAPAFAIVICL